MWYRGRTFIIRHSRFCVLWIQICSSSERKILRRYQFSFAVHKIPHGSILDVMVGWASCCFLLNFDLHYHIFCDFHISWQECKHLAQNVLNRSLFSCLQTTVRGHRYCSDFVLVSSAVWVVRICESLHLYRLILAAVRRIFGAVVQESTIYSTRETNI